MNKHKNNIHPETTLKTEELPSSISNRYRAISEKLSDTKIPNRHRRKRTIIAKTKNAPRTKPPQPGNGSKNFWQCLKRDHLAEKSITEGATSSRRAFAEKAFRGKCVSADFPRF